MSSPTTFTAGDTEFVVNLDELAFYRLVGAGLVGPSADAGENFLGRYEGLLLRMAESLDVFTTAIAAVCRRQVDERNLGHADFAKLFRDVPTRLAALDAFVAAARMEFEARRRAEDPEPVGMVSKA